MNPSMLADFSRMSYFIDNKKYPFLVMIFNLKLTFPLRSLNPNIQWIQEYIGSLSSFLHQGIFPDFFVLWITGRPVMTASRKSLWFSGEK
jgi:hypothetical protein